MADAAPVPAAAGPADMLRHALDAERAALARYVERRVQADALGEHGLAVALDSVIADETRHRDELRLVLADWADGAPRDRGAEVTLDSMLSAAVARMRKSVADAVEELLDDTSDDSFPASDPPSWIGMHAGAPRAGSELR